MPKDNAVRYVTFEEFESTVDQINKNFVRIDSQFEQNPRKIEKWELDAACDQIRLYALKDDIDPYGKDIWQAIKELVSAAKKHNANLGSDS